MSQGSHFSESLQKDEKLNKIYFDNRFTLVIRLLNTCQIFAIKKIPDLRSDRRNNLKRADSNPSLVKTPLTVKFSFL